MTNRKRSFPHPPSSPHGACLRHWLSVTASRTSVGKVQLPPAKDSQPQLPLGLHHVSVSSCPCLVSRAETPSSGSPVKTYSLNTFYPEHMSRRDLYSQRVPKVARLECVEEFAANLPAHNNPVWIRVQLLGFGLRPCVSMFGGVRKKLKLGSLAHFFPEASLRPGTRSAYGRTLGSQFAVRTHEISLHLIALRNNWQSNL